MMLAVSPILLLAAIAILLFDGRPLLFRQTRIGIHGKPFELLKFRTMKLEPDGTAASSDEQGGAKSGDSPALDPTGKAEKESYRPTPPQ